MKKKKIIKINKRYINQCAEVALESSHPLEKKATFGYYKKILRERFKKGHEIFYGYFENGKLIGYATLKTFFPGYKHCEFYWLAVRKSHQGEGIGTKLILYRERIAKKLGFRKACVYMNKKNHKIIKLYKRRGYKLINEFPGYYGYNRNNTAVLYAKKLK